MVVDVEMGVVDPDGVVEDGDLEEPLPVARYQVDDAHRRALDELDVDAARFGAQGAHVADVGRGDVHADVAPLHEQERVVLGAQSVVVPGGHECSDPFGVGGLVSLLGSPAGGKPERGEGSVAGAGAGAHRAPGSVGGPTLGLLFRSDRAGRIRRTGELPAGPPAVASTRWPAALERGAPPRVRSVMLVRRPRMSSGRIACCQSTRARP